MQKFDGTGVVEKLSWEKPERKDQAGSVVVFGGVSLKLKEVNSIYTATKNAGANSTVVLVPESLARGFKVADSFLISVDFNSHFGLADTGLKRVSEEFGLADALILADLGRNSETQFKLLNLITYSLKPVIVTSFAVELFFSELKQLIENSNITLILNFSQLQKLYRSLDLDFTRSPSNAGVLIEAPPLSTHSSKLKLKSLTNIQSHLKARIILVDEGMVMAVCGSQSEVQHLNLKLKNTIEELAAQLALWQIWSPRSLPLEQLFMANQDK